MPLDFSPPRTTHYGQLTLMIHVALWEPETPPNTGNIARLCAATGTTLHLIGRLGFRIDDKHLKRAGCDYWPEVSVSLHNSLEEFEASISASRVFPFSARVATPYTRISF